jgi:hypothetical protein
MDTFWSKERMFRLSPLRGAYFGAFAVLFVLTEWGRKVYRPFVYANGIHDWGIADVIGNLGGTLVVIFFNLGTTHATRAQGLRMVGLVTGGLMAYEIVQGVLPRSVFDWKDLAVTPIAGLIALGLLVIVHRLLPGGKAAGTETAGEST